MVAPSTSSSSRLKGIWKRAGSIAHGHKDRIAGGRAFASLMPRGKPLLQLAEAFLAGNALVVGEIVGLAHEGVDGADGVSSRRGSATNE